MEPRVIRTATVLAICPCSKGFGFAVLEKRGLLVSWGLARLYSKNDDEFLVRLDGLVEKHRAVAMCVERSLNHRRSKRAERLIGIAAEYGAMRRLVMSEQSGAQLRCVLDLGVSAPKYALAMRVTELFPELSPHLPPPRRAWSGQDERMNVFMAVALAFAGGSALTVV